VNCENSWNRPLFERRNVRDIDPPFLRALQRSDPDFVRRTAFDVEDPRRRSERIEEFAAVDVHKQVLSEGQSRLQK
jgi:hypothetical protein